MDIFFNNGILNKNKLRESWIIKNLPDIYQKITELDNSDIIFSNKLYNYYNNITEKPLCIQCNSDFKRFKGFKDGYDNFCSKRCASNNSLPDALEKRKRNTIEKWGVDHTSKLSSVKKKQEETNIKKYGYKSPTQNKDIKKKQEETMLSRWGVENTGSSTYLMNKAFKTRFDNYKKQINETFVDLDIIDIPKEGNLIIRCDKCNENYEIKTYLLRLRKLRYKINPCLLCNPNNSYKYSGQNEIIDFIKEHVDNIEIGNRSILMGKELDIYLPDHNLAIEYNGLYWHSDLYKDKDYHLNELHKN